MDVIHARAPGPWSTHEDETDVAVFIGIVEVHAEEPRNDGDQCHGEHSRSQKELQLDELVSVAVQLDVDVIL